MKNLILIIISLFTSLCTFSQTTSTENTTTKPAAERNNSWSINIIFSDNGFGAGATLFHQLSKDVSSFGSIFFSGAKDDREFDATDVFGNTFTPYKINRIFMIPLNIGMQVRFFREDVTDNLRPQINFGITPTALIYTPYDKSFFPSFGYAKAKYTIGVFAGVGVDYLTSKKSSLNFNVRYYYTRLFGEGIESLKNNEKNFFGGLYFVFGYNFMK